MRGRRDTGLNRKKERRAVPPLLGEGAGAGEEFQERQRWIAPRLRHPPTPTLFGELSSYSHVLSRCAKWNEGSELEGVVLLELLQEVAPMRNVGAAVIEGETGRTGRAAAGAGGVG